MLIIEIALGIFAAYLLIAFWPFFLLAALVLLGLGVAVLLIALIFSSPQYAVVAGIAATVFVIVLALKWLLDKPNKTPKQINPMP